jgi:hypothetical protein
VKKLVLGLVLLVVASLLVTTPLAAKMLVYVHTEERVVEVLLDGFSTLEGTVAYQGPAMGEGENWREARYYRGVSVLSVLQAAGALPLVDTLGVVAADGWFKILPREVLFGTTPAGVALLAIERDGASGGDWEDAPVLIFLPEDEAFSNQDMLEALGEEYSHYFGDQPSTTGMMVKGVLHLVPNYDGESLALQPEASSQVSTDRPQGSLLTVVRGEATQSYTQEEIEALEQVTGAGTFTTSTNALYTATYTGVPLTTFIGNVPGDTTIRVTASDGYSMNYPASMLQDTSEGTWILAYQANGMYMPFDPGYLRIVQVGPDTPHFSSSLSAKMVERIEVLGEYEQYSLRLLGALERVFTRGELEAGVGCPCHTVTVSVTSRDVTSRYTGLPLWRLLAYVDDAAYPPLERGIHYEEEHFNDELAAMAYVIELVAQDGYSQTVTSDLVTRDDRFIVALKKDGIFLDPEDDGYMRFVYDDSVQLPEGMRLRSVKLLNEILLHL